METFDLMLVHVYLLAIFSVVVKNRVSIHLYRLLKLLVLFLTATTVYLFFAEAMPDNNVFMPLVRLLSLFALFLVFINQEIRALLKMIGAKTGLLISNAIEDVVKEEVLYAIDYLSRHKIGAILTFERTDSLDDYIKNAFAIEAAFSSELISTIFMPNTPLHDGAVIVKENTIKCAGAYFPPSESPKLPKYLGSRHRAAIGISEQTDSLTIVVSEETGQISVTVDGYLDQDISQDSLVLYLEKYLQN